MASQSVENDSSELSCGAGGTGFMLFGVRLIEGSFRKSASTNNLAQFEAQPNNDVAAGYASDDVVHTSDRNRNRKRGVAWSEEEHRLFLLGLQKVGKGDWRGISRNFVKTRTPTQVASHAQKYFLRRNNHHGRRRRSSLFDITTEAVLSLTPASEDKNLPQATTTPQENQNKNNIEKLPISTENPAEKMPILQVNQLNNSPGPLLPIPILPSLSSSKMTSMDLNRATAVDGPFSAPPPQKPSGRHLQSFNGSGGDSIISVA